MTHRPVLAIVLAAVCAGVAAPAAQADALSYQADAAHAGFVEAQLKPPLGRKWIRRGLGEQVSYPIVAEGRVFVTDGALLHALDARTGTALWSRPVDFQSRLGYGRGRLVVTGAEALTAVDPADGRTLWTAPGGTFAAIGVGDMVISTREHALSGRRWEDGIEVWSSYAPYVHDRMPTSDGERVFTLGECRDTTAFHPLLGAELWRYDGDCSGGYGTLPAIADGESVYVPAGPWTVLDAVTGMPRGQLTARHPAVAGGVAYDASVFLRAIDIKAGTVKWELAPPANYSYVGPPLVVGDVVYVRTSGQDLLAVDRDSGRLIWRREQSLADAPEVTPIDAGLAANERVLVVPAHGRLIAFGPGRDAPHVDDPDRTPAGSYRFDFRALQQTTLYGGGVRLAAAIRGPTSRVVDLQASPYPYRRWRTIARRRVGLDLEYFRVKPVINTRYRLLDRDTLPPKRSIARQVYLELSGSAKFYVHGRNGVRVVTRFRAPPAVALQRRRVHVYRFRKGGLHGRRVGRLRIRRRGHGHYRASGVVRTPHLSASDRFGFCIPKVPPRGYGKRRLADPSCGRARV